MSVIEVPQHVKSMTAQWSLYHCKHAVKALKCVLASFDHFDNKGEQELKEETGFGNVVSQIRTPIALLSTTTVHSDNC